MGELEQTVARHDEQIKTLFKNQENLAELTKSVTQLVSEMKYIKAGQEKIEQAVDELRSEPKKRWNTVVTALITGVVGAIVGAVMASIF
jgi:uncharacterized protein YbcI